MDPLSVTANVITVLQLANSIISICYDVRANLNKAPWSLTRVADEIKDLRNVLEQVEKASERLDQSCTADSKQLCVFKLLVEPENGPLARCHEELAILEKKIVSSYGHRTSISKQRAFLQVMGWQLKESDAKACLARIDRCKSTILMALTADEATLLADIQRMTGSLNIAVEKMSITVSKISTHFETQRFGTSHPSAK
ncbi:hypothetical protein BS50DRAFT_236580 [Corynespora cassiicola Philippines]|uniref:Fungal N-terminal domain-containing protein n=1 Tax=Corynespora cassiicola Philippines TaxID=1448308 RepID=A0A2T2P2C5_CORCC|nr:hypothetical protein BS50DRAFT_236580 [Corynespora cassiicola Philippines]